MKNNLPAKYHVYSPNTKVGDSLLERNMCEIRPDIIIEKNDKVVMIIDAKYKNYLQFGKSSVFGVSREDVYQMTTYLHHYGKEDQSIIGLFTSPVSCHNNDVHAYSHNKMHRIGLINLDIESAKGNIESLHSKESEYLSKIIEILNSL